MTLREMRCHELESNQRSLGFNQVLYLLSYRDLDGEMAGPRRFELPISRSTDGRPLRAGPRPQALRHVVEGSNLAGLVLETGLRPAPDVRRKKATSRDETVVSSTGM